MALKIGQVWRPKWRCPHGPIRLLDLVDGAWFVAVTWNGRLTQMMRLSADEVASWIDRTGAVTA